VKAPTTSPVMILPFKYVHEGLITLYVGHGGKMGQYLSTMQGPKKSSALLHFFLPITCMGLHPVGEALHVKPYAAYRQPPRL
jgi:hypothetical protein